MLFTHCDEDVAHDRDYAEDWYNNGMLDQMELPEIRGDRIFLFKGKNGQGGTATTHEQLTQWVNSMVPPSNEYAQLKQIDYA